MNAFYATAMFILLDLVALYNLVAAVCIANRMTKKTHAYRRWLVVAIGVLAVWGLLRTFDGGWPPTKESLAHIAAIILAAIYLLKNPRVTV